MNVIARQAAGESRRAATRGRLVDSATSLFASRGLHEVTSHEIAQAAGVAAGTFYLHFKDKQTLFGEIIFEAVSQLKERLERAAQSAGDPTEAVRRRASELLSFAEEKRNLVRILFGGNIELAGLDADVLDDVVSWFEDDLRPRFAGTAIECKVAAQAIVGMWARVLSWWAEVPERAPREVVVGILTRLQLSEIPGAAEP
jgi:AcrR family transcriptional regulator